MCIRDSSKSADHEGRAAIRMDGVEVLRSNYYTYFENVCPALMVSTFAVTGGKILDVTPEMCIRDR